MPEGNQGVAIRRIAAEIAVYIPQMFQVQGTFVTAVIWITAMVTHGIIIMAGMGSPKEGVQHAGGT